MSDAMVSFNLRVSPAAHRMLKGAATIHARTTSEEGRLGLAIHSRRSLLAAIDAGWLGDIDLGDHLGGDLASYRQQIADEVAVLERQAFARPAVGAVLAQAIAEVAASN